MRGFEGFLADVILPALFVSLFCFAIGIAVRRDWRKRHQWSESAQQSVRSATKEFIKLAMILVWVILMFSVVYRDLRFHYDLWALQSNNVQEISVGGHCLTDRSSIAEIVTALKSSEWYSVNHGGWGDETSIVVKMTSGTAWQMRAGYHFAQHGAVVLRSSAPNGSGWHLGQVFSPTLPGILEHLGVPLSHCDIAHGHPCPISQTALP